MPTFIGAGLQSAMRVKTAIMYAKCDGITDAQLGFQDEMSKKNLWDAMQSRELMPNMDIVRRLFKSFAKCSNQGSSQIRSLT